MSTFNWPGLGIKSISWSFDQPAQVNASPWSGKRTVVSDPWHGKWSARVDLASRQGDSAFLTARAFFTQLAGQVNTFHLPAVEQAQNGNTGVTLASNAAQGAASLSLTGVTTALVAGNMATIAGQLLSITSVGSLSGGAQTITFKPKLRAAATAGASVETAKPYALVALTDSSFTWDIGMWRRYGLSFSVDEAVGETDGADPLLDIWTGGVGGGGGGGGTSFSFPELPSFTTRALLAAVASPSDKQLAYLTEAGREGEFIFSTANFVTLLGAALTTVDPQQGVYVAPASDTTGASGAWVRKIVGPYVSLWWGVSTTNTASQNVTAFRAALSTLAAISPTATYAYFVFGSVPLYTPAGVYQFNDELKPNSAVDIYGDSEILGGGTVFVWSGSSGHGINILGWDGGGYTTSNYHGTGSSVRKLTLRGWYSGTRSAQHAVNINGQARCDRLFFDNWPGIGCYAAADVGTSSGNDNLSSFTNLYGQGCDLTLKLEHGDANACYVAAIQGQGNRLGTYWDWSFLGNAAFQIYAENNGLDGNFRSRCVYGGHTYVVAYGQETWCSTHAPTGAATSNQGWLYLNDNGTTFYSATWVTGQTWYFTSPISIGPPDNGNTHGAALSCYIEGGQNPIMLAGGATCTTTTSEFVYIWQQDGTPHGGSFGGSASTMHFNNGISLPGSITALGNAQNFGPASGASTDLLANFNTTNTLYLLFNRYNSDGSLAENMGYILSTGVTYINGTSGVHLRHNGTDVATTVSGGLDLPSGKVLSVAGTQVVTARQTGTPADATDLATALTLVNALKAKLITHGLIS